MERGGSQGLTCRPLGIYIGGLIRSSDGGPEVPTNLKDLPENSRSELF